MELNDWNGKQIAEALRVTASRVSRALALLDLPEAIQQQVEAGTLPKSSAYEISKLNDDRAQTQLATKVAGGELSHSKTVKQVNQRRGKKSSNSRQGVHQVFFAENKMKVTVSCDRKANYHEVEQALLDVLEEVRHRISNNIKLF